MAESRGPNVGLIVSRFLFLLGLAVWLGGLAFVAVGAPAMFKVNRLLGPQMVGAAMGSFTSVTYICAVLLLIGWLGDRFLGGGRSRDKAWTAQGVCIGAMIVIAAYLGNSVMPEMVALQPTVVAQSQRALAGTSTPVSNSTADAIAKARFDKAHKDYRQMTSFLVLLGLGNLFFFCVRISRPASGGGTLLREGSIFMKSSI